MTESILRKWMPVARPIGEFRNGDDTGILDAAVINELIENFKRNTEVPIYLWQHVDDLDELVPDGWVEDMRVRPDGMLEVLAKLHGQAADLVSMDRIRRASISWRVKAKGYKGEPVGAMLMHITLTNNPYIKDLPNIAAARAQGGGPLSHCFIALPDEEVGMADEKDKKIADLEGQIASLKAAKPEETAQKLKEAETLLAEKIKSELELTAENANLKEELEKFQTNPQLDEAVKKLKQQERRLKAADIRRFVAEGVAAGKFTIKHVGEKSKGWGHVSDEGVLTWFKESIFGDSIDRLEFALKTYEAVPLHKSYQSGVPSKDAEEINLTAEEKEELRKLGMDPDAVIAGMKGREAVQAYLKSKEN